MSVVNRIFRFERMVIYLDKKINIIVFNVCSVLVDDQRCNL